MIRKAGQFPQNHAKKQAFPNNGEGLLLSLIGKV